MTSLQHLLTSLRSKNVRLSVVEGKLQIDARKGTLTTGEIESIRLHKAAIVTCLDRAANRPQIDEETIRPQVRSGAIPLSLAQQRMWFIAQFGNTGAAYHVPAAARLLGPLDRAAMRAALNALVRRHESLRTVFGAVDGEPVQIVLEASELALEQYDFSTLPEAERGAELTQRVACWLAEPFDLHTGPLVRGRLVRLSDTEHVLLLTMHHIVTDGWSAGILTRELGLLYAAFREGRPSPLAPLAIQYADYTLWQRRRLQGSALQEQIEYWRHQLHGVPTLLELPCDKPRPSVQSYRGDTIAVMMGPELAGPLKRLSLRLGVTTYMVLLATYAILLSRLSGQRDVVIGTPSATRQRPELESLIGFFLNTLALRVHVTSDLTVRDFLNEIRNVTLDAYTHQELPFEQVVEIVRPARSTAHSPVFQTQFVLNNSPRNRAQLSGLTLGGFPLQRTTTQFDMSLQLMEGPDVIVGELVYATDLFERSTVERWLENYKQILGAMAADPDQRLAQLQWLSAAERHRLAVSFNQTAPQPLCEAPVHQLFRAQVALTPNMVAVIGNGLALSYAELNTRADRLASQLRRRNVKSEVPVALFMTRSVDLLVAILGVLKAGGYYVPVDPKYPRGRIDYVLGDCGARIVLTSRDCQERLPEGRYEAVCLDELAAEVNHSDASAAHADSSTTNLAYVLYTSGATGRPKGVMIEHAALSNFLVAMKARPGIRADEVVLATTTISFDIAALELFLPLLVGARVIIAPDGLLQDVKALTTLVRQHSVTLMQATPATWQMLLDEEEWEPGPTFRAFCGGDVLSACLLARLGARASEVWNLYGPTETTVWSSCVRVYPSEPISIGTPIGNTSFYVLDADGALCGIGAPGELHIGGAGLARGYLNRPALTAERFVANPIAEGDAGRLYRTGDLVRWRSDGKLEFLGRLDHQVKVQGIRMELGEIEAQLLCNEQVQRCIVLSRRNALGEAYLVAYVIPAQRIERADMRDGFIESLRVRLSESLPSYMVPAVFMILETLPLTSNGKVDRNALPDVEVARPEHVEPRNALETTLCEIWQNVLEMERIGIHDNFFALGGHSLAMTRVQAQASRTGLRFTVAQLFEHQTIAALARFLQQRPSPAAPAAALHASSNPSLVQLNRSSAERRVFAFHPLSGLTLCYAAMAEGLRDCCQMYGLQHPALFSDHEIPSIESLAAFYVELIQATQPRGPYYLLGWSLGGDLAYEVAHQLAGRQEAIGYVGILDSAPALACDATSPPSGSGFRALRDTYAGQLEVCWRELEMLPLNEVIAHLAREAVRQHAKFEGIGEVSLLRFLRLLAGMPAMRARYAPMGSALNLDLYRVKYLANEDLFRLREERDYGWSRLVSGRVRVIDVPGIHNDMILRPHIDVLLVPLRERLQHA